MMHKLLSLIYNLQSTIDLHLFKKTFIHLQINYIIFKYTCKKIHQNANYIIDTIYNGSLLYHYYDDNYKKSLNFKFHECNKMYIKK